ncbi:MAG: uroporphyrinogen decarboxylase [Alphaproteobacteria bacterium]|nr:uroporphyrinogen decarboxylase [Alphaproteobacteria bacterium]
MLAVNGKPVIRESVIGTDKPLLRVLRGETVSPPPLWLMRQAGRYLPEYRVVRQEAGSFLDLCYDPALACEVTLQPIRRFHLGAAIIFSDILVVPHAMGQEVSFVEGKGPVLSAVRSTAELKTLSDGPVRDRLAPVYEAIRRVRAELPADVALIGFAGAPWTVASYMVEGASSRDFAYLKGWAWRDRAGFGQLIDRLTAATIDHLCAQVEAGAEVVQLFESWAGAVPDALFEAFCFRPVVRIAEAVKKAHPSVPLIVFPRGAGARSVDFARHPAVDAVGIDTSQSAGWAAAEIQPHAAVQGNLDPVLLIQGGRALRDEAERLVRALGKGPFVFNLGHGVLPTTPADHVAELVDAVRRAAG